MHIAIAAPLDARRLAEELVLVPGDGAMVPQGHGGHSVTELVLALAPLVDGLDLVTLDPRLDHPVDLHGDGVRLAVGPSRDRGRGRDLFAVERSFIEGQLRSWRPDAVSAHWTYEYALGALDAGLPTLVTVRDWAPTILWHARDAYRAARLLMQGMVFARGRHFAAVSPYMAGKVHRITRRSVAVLPNAVGPMWLDAPAPQPIGVQVVAVNAGFGRRKNVTRLLAAWPSVREQQDDAELVLVGQGYEVNGVAYEWARRRGLTEAVRFHGPIDRAELPGLIASARLLVHPSLEESFGMVILEAMALGLPVLGGRRSGAVPWLLEDEAGVLVDVRSPAAIADGISRLLGDKSFALQTAARGQQRARERFSSDAAARAYVDVLTRVGSGGR
ncbi:glycosyltransferase family 4 protein [Nitriliruptor alkaliphilus]|uniref:glycosyltransferase family 4 protein n=1 Tax=Nitriliruptor alkaliphilus TaxID=427918 RepID=UPI000B18BF0C|nr:glycosyltransferase family 4 protein [Nitriliruptor alkaliphilus]